MNKQLAFDKPIVVLGTRNRKKLEELQDHLQRLPIDFRTLADIPAAPEVVEDGETFLDNARKKAVIVAQAIHQWVLGEDSGLVVDALGGRPGVYSARFSGPAATDEANNRKLLDELSQTPTEKRTAHYVSTIVLADPQGTVRGEVAARCNGIIGSSPRGSQGFGYDPLFIIPEYHKTFAELGIVAKRHLSHRARAIAKLEPILRATVLERTHGTTPASQP